MIWGFCGALRHCHSWESVSAVSCLVSERAHGALSAQAQDRTVACSKHSKIGWEVSVRFRFACEVMPVNIPKGLGIFKALSNPRQLISRCTWSSAGIQVTRSVKKQRKMVRKIDTIYILLTGFAHRRCRQGERMRKRDAYQASRARARARARAGVTFVNIKTRQSMQKIDKITRKNAWKPCKNQCFSRVAFTKPCKYQ